MDGVDVEEIGNNDRLPDHQLPKVIEDLIEKGKYDNMQKRVVMVCLGNGLEERKYIMYSLSLLCLYLYTISISVYKYSISLHCTYTVCI